MKYRVADGQCLRLDGKTYRGGDLVQGDGLSGLVEGGTLIKIKAKKKAKPAPKKDLA
jgi:hypothetical protein